MSKKNDLACIRAVRDRYQDNEIISAAADNAFLRELLARHPRAAEKIGVGVSHFVVTTDAVWHKTRGFVIVRTDGSSTDFSFMKCLNGENLKTLVHEALRGAVVDQILDFKNNEFARGIVYCVFTHERLTSDSGHVDHAPPNTFDVLARRWMNENNLSLGDVQISGPQDNNYRRVMTDEEQKSSWQQFHAGHAILRVISRTGNLSHSKRQATVAA
jgi:hypothetical protein